MEFCENMPISSEYQQEQPLSRPCSLFSGSTGSIDDLFSAQNTEEDMNLEWLSIYVEDCFSNQGSCFPAPTYVNVPLPAAITNSKRASTCPLQKSQDSSSPLQNFVVPGKARSKRKRVAITTPQINNSLSTWSNSLLKSQPLHVTSSDPPLLKQAYWLADSELIVTKNESESVMKDDEHQLSTAAEVVMGVVTSNKDSSGSLVVGNTGQQPMPRRCSHCLSQKTPQWRAGPLGPKTLCNACGVRYKSGRLLPEYRPAKSPTFVSYLHSNSHKKVMEMRMALP